MNFVELRELETERLRLRRVRFDDLYDYYERLGSDGEVTRYLTSTTSASAPTAR